MSWIIAVYRGIPQVGPLGHPDRVGHGRREVDRQAAVGLGEPVVGAERTDELGAPAGTEVTQVADPGRLERDTGVRAARRGVLAAAYADGDVRRRAARVVHQVEYLVRAGRVDDVRAVGDQVDYLHAGPFRDRSPFCWSMVG